MTRTFSQLTRGLLTALVLVPSVLATAGIASADVVVGTPIDTEPGPQGTGTYQVQFSPTSPATKAYAVQYGSNEIDVINPTTSEVTRTIPVGNGPVAVAFTPDGSWAYVADYLGDQVDIINTSTESVSLSLPVCTGPYDVMMSPNGAFAAFSCYGDETVRLMSTSSHAIVRTYKLRNSGVWQARYTPDGKRIYAVGNSSGFIYVLDANKNKVLKKIKMRGQPWWLEVSPDGTEVMVTDHVDSGISTVAVINVKKNKVVGRVTIGSSVYALAYDPAGDYLYVVNDITNVVSVIDTDTRLIVDTFTTSGTQALEPTISPNGTIGYVGDDYGLITKFTPY